MSKFPKIIFLIMGFLFSFVSSLVVAEIMLSEISLIQVVSRLVVIIVLLGCNIISGIWLILFTIQETFIGGYHPWKPSDIEIMGVEYGDEEYDFIDEMLRKEGSNEKEKKYQD